MRVFGALLVAFGFLISLSIVGAIIGIPMILMGIVCLIAGGRRKTIITNVVNVNTPEPRQQPEDWRPVERDQLYRRNEPKLIDATPVHPAPRPADRKPAATINAKGYDEEKWAAVCQYDDDIHRVVAALKPYGERYVDELARAYLTLNEKQYLPMIVQKIIEMANRDAAVAGATGPAAQRQSSRSF